MRNYLLSFYDRCLEGKRLRLHYRTVKTTSVHQILNAYATIFILHMCIIYLLTFISIIFLFRSTYTLSVWQNGTAYNFFGSKSCVLHFRYKRFRIKIKSDLKLKRQLFELVILWPFLVILLPITLIFFTKLRFWRSLQVPNKSVS